MQNVSHENHENQLIFMLMTVQVTYILIPIVSHKADSFCRRGKSKLGIGLFIHELLREPSINPNFAFLQALKVMKSGHHLLDDQASSG